MVVFPRWDKESQAWVEDDDAARLHFQKRIRVTEHGIALLRDCPITPHRDHLRRWAALGLAFNYELTLAAKTAERKQTFEERRQGNWTDEVFYSKALELEAIDLSNA